MSGLHHRAVKASALPLSLIAQAIPRLSRCDLESLTERLIDRLDELDGDPDEEADGDERDYNNAEDDFADYRDRFGVDGPGCPVSDPGEVEAEL